MIKRILVVSACLVALIGVLVFPASAADVDYNDYITNIQVDGDNDIVTVKLPFDPEISLYSNNPFVLQYQTDTTRLDFEVTAGVSYSLGLFAFRSYALILDNIPDGSLFTLTYEFSPVFGYVTKPTIMSRNYFYGSDGSYLAEHRIYSDDFGLTSQTFQFPYNKPSGASYGKFEFYWDGITFQESGSKSFIFRDFTIVMSISSLYRLQQETGKTNKILSEVEKQLADQGKTLDAVLGAQKDTNEKLDQIIDGTVTPSAPAGSDAVGDLDDLEGGLRDDSQAGLDQGLAMQQSALSVFLQYAAAFAVAGDIFGIFADIPFFSYLLYVSVSIGLFALLLNLGFDGISAIERKQKSNKMKQKSKKGG